MFRGQDVIPQSQKIRDIDLIIVCRLDCHCAVRDRMGVGDLRARKRFLPCLNSYERPDGRQRVISKRSVLLSGKFPRDCRSALQD